MNFNELIDIYTHSPFMWISTFLMAILWPLTLLAFLKVNSGKAKVNIPSFIVLSLLCFVILGLGLVGYQFTLNLTQQSLGGLSSEAIKEVLSLSKKDANANLYFSILAVSPTFLFFIICKLKTSLA